jgi:hypothetical protein
VITAAVRRQQVAGTTIASVTKAVAIWTVLFLVAHVPLGVMVQRDPRVAVVHALATVAVGLVWALFGARRPERVAYVAAYIVGAEVLWRMAGSQIAWEFGKYGVVAVLGAWMLQNGRLRGPNAATVYLACLLPSAILTLQAEDLGQARQQIAFNLSGPFCLMISVWFFSQVRLSPEQRQHLYVAGIGATMAIAAITFVSTILNPEIEFGSESNVQAAGGFGPNQVSAMLGLGALFALLAMAEGHGGWGFKPTMTAALVLFSVQSALTLSRGGLVNAAVAAIAGSLFFLSDPRTRIRVAVGVMVLSLLGYYVVFPALDQFTDGALTNRFSDSDLTNRPEILKADLQIWQDHAWLGVGPGQGNYHREAYIRNTPAHTEYTRMLAEHGVLGIASLVAMIVLVTQVLKQRRSPRETAVVAALLMWSFLFMLSYGMRLAAPAFVIGLACMPTSTQARLPAEGTPLRKGVVSVGRAVVRRPMRRRAYRA